MFVSKPEPHLALPGLSPPLSSLHVQWVNFTTLLGLCIFVINPSKSARPTSPKLTSLHFPKTYHIPVDMFTDVLCFPLNSISCWRTGTFLSYPHCTLSTKNTSRIWHIVGARRNGVTRWPLQHHFSWVRHRWTLGSWTPDPLLQIILFPPPFYFV